MSLRVDPKGSKPLKQNRAESKSTAAGGAIPYNPLTPAPVPYIPNVKDSDGCKVLSPDDPDYTPNSYVCKIPDGKDFVYYEGGNVYHYQGSDKTEPDEWLDDPGYNNVLQRVELQSSKLGGVIEFEGGAGEELPTRYTTGKGDVFKFSPNDPGESSAAGGIKLTTMTTSLGSLKAIAEDSIQAATAISKMGSSTWETGFVRSFVDGYLRNRNDDHSETYTVVGRTIAASRDIMLFTHFFVNNPNNKDRNKYALLDNVVYEAAPDEAGNLQTSVITYTGDDGWKLEYFPNRDDVILRETVPGLGNKVIDYEREYKYDSRTSQWFGVPQFNLQNLGYTREVGRVKAVNPSDQKFAAYYYATPWDERTTYADPPKVTPDYSSKNVLCSLGHSAADRGMCATKKQAANTWNTLVESFNTAVGYGSVVLLLLGFVQVKFGKGGVGRGAGGGGAGGGGGGGGNGSISVTNSNVVFNIIGGRRPKPPALDNDFELPPLPDADGPGGEFGVSMKGKKSLVDAVVDTFLAKRMAAQQIGERSELGL